jgi:hypothetical protein
MNPFLKFRSISKRFQGVFATDSIDLFPGMFRILRNFERLASTEQC